MDDLISRQAAIKCLLGILGKIDDEGYGWIPRRAAVEGIANLPSTMPMILACGSGELKQADKREDNGETKKEKSAEAPAEEKKKESGRKKWWKAIKDPSYSMETRQSIDQEQ